MPLPTKLFDKLDSFLNKPQPSDLQGLVTYLRELTDLKEQFSVREKEINKRVEALRYERIPAKMEEETVEMVAYEGVGKIHLQAGCWASIKPEWKPQAYEWLRDHGHGDLITNTVNAQSLAAMVRARVATGEEMPPDLFNVKPFTMAVLKRT